MKGIGNSHARPPFPEGLEVLSQRQSDKLRGERDKAADGALENRTGWRLKIASMSRGPSENFRRALAWLLALSADFC
jgi:hypothetical protein